MKFRLTLILLIASGFTQMAWASHSCQKLVIIGDSLTVFLEHYGTLNGYPVTFKGVSGQWTVNMADRFTADVLHSGADCVFILGGTNDLTGTYQGWGGQPTQATHEEMIWMLETARINGIFPFVGTIPPWGHCSGNGNCIADDPAWHRDSEVHVAYNAWIKSYLATCCGPVTIVDLFSVLVGDDGLHYIVGYTDDGVHENAAGAQAMTTLILQATGLQPLRPGNQLRHGREVLTH